MMTRVLPTIALLAGVLVPAASSAEDRRLETEHVAIEWMPGVTAAEVSAVRDAAEKYHAAVRDMLGTAPDRKITVLLQGPAERADGSRGYPHVDGRGRVHLYRYEHLGASYLSPLAHEMVHSFRLGKSVPPDWFFEEGFAEFVSLRVDPSLAGFPWYDMPVVVAAGCWLSSGTAISLVDMRERHRELNLRCRAQTYSLRGSFFDWLGRTHGDDAVLAMAREKSAGKAGDYERFFGTDLKSLESKWRTSMLDAFESTPDAAELARRYRHESPIQYMEVCEPGAGD